MKSFTIEISIVGDPGDIIRFINDVDFQKTQMTYIDSFMPHISVPNNSKKICFVNFDSEVSPSKELVDNLQEKYKSFNVSVFWYNIKDRGDFGFIENNGTEYKITNLQDLKEAVKIHNIKFFHNK